MGLEPAEEFLDVSPHGDYWLGGSTLTAHPTAGGFPVPICIFCSAGWGPGGRFHYLRFRGVGEMGQGKVIAIGLLPGRELPALPRSGMKSIEDTKRLNIVSEVDTTGMTFFVPGPNPTVYAFARATVQRNLFRIPLH